MSKVGKAYGSRVGQARWDRNCDIFPDNLIDIRDVARVGKNYGKECPLGCVGVTVESNSNPLEGAFVYVNSTYIGTTNSTGQAEKCGRIEPGNYTEDEGIEVYYEDTQFCPNTNLIVDDTGTGSATVIRNSVTVTIHVQDSEGYPLIAKVWIYQGTTELFGPQLTDENGDTTFCLEDGSNYRAKAELINGDISMSGYFTVSGTSFTVTITY